MPKIIGKGVTVVEHDGMKIDELAGNVSTQEDTLSIAHVDVSKATAEPWLTLQYDEWICCSKGVIEMHYEEDGETKVLAVQQGETCFVAKGERFRPVFPQAGVEYTAICLPAFKPERCHREEEGVSDVAVNLAQLHSGEKTSDSSAADQTDILYHMCQKSLWEEAVASGEAYFPPTFEEDGGFTHATAVPARLIDTANHFYTATSGDWICLELSLAALKKIGIVTRFEEPKPVGDTGTDNEWNEWRCPHIFGGLPAQVTGILKKTYPLKRDEKGNFLCIDGLTN